MACRNYIVMITGSFWHNFQTPKTAVLEPDSEQTSYTVFPLKI
jgi:hypothetical protein